MTAEDPRIDRPHGDGPLEDLFPDAGDLPAVDDELPDLTAGPGRGTDATGAADAASVLPDLAAGEQASLVDLGGDWEGPAVPSVADAGDDWAPVVPAPAASREARRAARAARRARQGSEAGARGGGPVARAAAAAAAAAEPSGPAPETGTDARPVDATPVGGPQAHDDVPAVPALEPSSLFSSEDPGTEKPKRPLTAEERLQHAITLAYRHLSKRDRTVAEVRAHLEKRSIDAASVTGAIAELVEVGYLDDARYAERFVEDKRRLEGWGHLRIEQGLRRTGIETTLVDAALADDPLRDDEDELAVDALEQRLRGAAPDGDRGRQKALRMLATKGYALETAYAAVRTYERRCAERAED